MGNVLTNHKPPDSGLLALGQVWVRLIDDHDGANYNGGANGGEDAQENRDGPFICEVIGDFDLEGIVMVVRHHEGRAGRIEGEVENRHNDAGAENPID